MDRNTIPGSKWWKFDFHTHTPASECFGGESTPEDWLLGYMRAEIDCVAITDHNSGEWIDILKSTFQDQTFRTNPDFRPLAIFPGVELSTYEGYHAIILFDYEASSADVNSFVDAVKYRGKKGGSTENVGDNISDVIAEIERRKGILIPAHVDEDNGLFKEWEKKELAPLLECDKIVAMELRDTNYSLPGIYTAKETNWTSILGSDCHFPNADRFPGSHFTWVKMSSPSLEGVRLALLDNQLSIIRSDAITVDPNAIHCKNALRSLKVSEAAYIGRNQEFVLECSPWLSCIIGGRGTGKSTLLEFFRKVMGREAEIPLVLSGELAKYQKVKEDRHDDGLLQSNTVFTAEYEKEGELFQLSWSNENGVAPILKQNNSGQWEQVEGDIRQRFPIRIYSQKQIYELARKPGSLLRVIDESQQVNFHDWQDDFTEAVNRYIENRASIRQLAIKVKDESRLKGELADTLRKIELFEKSGHSDILKKYQRASRIKGAVDAWEKDWSSIGQSIRDLLATLSIEDMNLVEFKPLSANEEALEERAKSHKGEYRALFSELSALAEKADLLGKTWTESAEYKAWLESHETTKNEYQALKDSLEEQGVADSAEYEKLVQERQRIEGEIAGIEELKKELDSKEKQSASILEQVKAMRKALTQKRSDFLNTVLADNVHVRISVLPYDGRDSVEDSLRTLIGKEGDLFASDIGVPEKGGGLLGRLYAGGIDINRDDEAAISRKTADFEIRLKEMKTTIHSIASEQFDQVQDRRFIAALSKLQAETLDHVDCWFPEDSLKVEYCTRKSNEWRPLSEGSPGQKTAALLAFLFSYGTEPLLLDQPEDDLDNQLIYNLIVNQLREIKSKRQVIIVTHNANIVVNGDAELVVSLSSSSGRTEKACCGGLQEVKVRKEICDVMEGGTDAFRQRYMRIHEIGKL